MNFDASHDGSFSYIRVLILKGLQDGGYQILCHPIESQPAQISQCKSPYLWVTILTILQERIDSHDG